MEVSDVVGFLKAMNIDALMVAEIGLGVSVAPCDVSWTFCLFK